MSGTIFADLRCLQDVNYRVRGIGHHVAALLRARERSFFSNWKMVGLLDPAWPALPPECASLVDEISYSVNPCAPKRPAIFLDATPMTHDPRFSLRFLNHQAFFRAAAVYDFIPLDWPGYLDTAASRIDYFSKLTRLKAFDFFLPISEYTAWRLSELLGVSRSRVQVTGASVRLSLYEMRRRLGNVVSPYERNEPYFLIVIGPDVRKNPEVAVKAVRRVNLIYARRIPLIVVGHYEDRQKNHLLRLAGHSEGEGFLEFRRNISDEELVLLLTGAVATIVPSHIEGFSLPIVEASVCGCPAVVSTCAAHLELVERPEALFQSDDSVALSDRLGALIKDPELRASLAASQKQLGSKFDEEAVGRRFWTGIEEGSHSRISTSVVRQVRRPRLAFLSPYPPDRSGVARFTAMTMQGGETLFDSDLYTSAPRPLTFEGSFHDSGPVSVAPLLNGRYDAVISVLGNSPYHNRIFEFFERYGGPCILHDARLTQIYFHRLGHDRFLQLAGKLLGRQVTSEEVAAWLQDRDPPLLFLEQIIERASPLIVHTVRQQVQLKQRYGVDAHVNTCCPTMLFSEDELSGAAKRAARERQGIPPNAFAVSSFGYVAVVKGMAECILAIELLRDWGIPADLYFVGSTEHAKGEVERLASSYGISDHVHQMRGFVDEETYRDFLVASDAGLQLRTYGFGQFSAALTDCTSAGLPTVANSDLALSSDAPEYIATVPDRFSPLLVAEQLALIWESRNARISREEARVAYLETHNFRYYGKRLLEILEIQ